MRTFCFSWWKFTWRRKTEFGFYNKALSDLDTRHLYRTLAAFANGDHNIENISLDEKIARTIFTPKPGKDDFTKVRSLRQFVDTCPFLIPLCSRGSRRPSSIRLAWWSWTSISIAEIIWNNSRIFPECIKHSFQRKPFAILHAKITIINLLNQEREQDACISQNA